MAQFEQHFVQDLTQPIKVRHCGTIVFNADDESNVISVRLFNGSEPVAISGSVVGAVVCSDGSTVTLSGSYSGNTASITLTGDCFAILGQIGVGIQIVNGTQKTTVLKAIYNVETLTTENVVDPGSRITLEVGDLIDDIETAVASIPADYSDLLAAIAPNYSGLTFPVKAGTFCWYDGTLYQAQQDIATSEAWTAAHWASSVLTTSLDEKLADVDDELGDLKSHFEPIEEEMYKTTTVTVGGSVEYANNGPYSYGLGNVRYFDAVAAEDYQIDSLKIRAYKRSGAEYKFKLVAIAFEGTFVYVRGLSDEITLDEPTDSYADYEIALDTPFAVLAGQRVGIAASDTNWWQYSNNGGVAYHNRTENYSSIALDYRMQTYLPTPMSGDIPVVFYSSGKELKDIIELDETLTKDGYAADAGAVGAALSTVSDDVDSLDSKTAILSLLASDKNTSQNAWQIGEWSTSSEATIGGNPRYISYTGYLDDVDTIVNSDPSKYKFGIVAHDLSQTYPSMGWYNPSTGIFERYAYNFVTDETFDLSVLRAKFPAYSFTVSLRQVTETNMTIDQYDALAFDTFRSPSAAYVETVIAKTLFVAYNGSDDNSGADGEHPLATINHALELGATRILMAGGSYFERIDLTKSRVGAVSIAALDPAQSPVIYAPNCKIAETESAVSGYTKVYSAATQHTFPATTSLIFEDGVADVSTAVSNSERHPLQRGSFYRCGDTAIYRCMATALNDALAEIEGSTVYKWFYDDGTIYFSRPEAVSAEHPLMTGLYAEPLFLSLGTRACSVDLCGLVIKYARANLDGFVSAKMTDCKVIGGCGAGIHYSNALNVILRRCDVSRAYSGGLGDGIAATGNSNYGWSYGTTLTMIDCWSHDNNDDGFSDHVGCESTIIGGLYEHNGKGGLIPTGGGSCTCYDVTSRNNAIGFEIAGAAGPVASGRNGQQMECHGCIADSNSQYGFFTAGNQDMTMRLYNCIAVNNSTGFAGANGVTGTELIAVDCAGYGNTTVKWGDVTVVTTEALT